MSGIPQTTSATRPQERGRSPRLPIFVKLTVFIAVLVIFAALLLSWTGYAFAHRLLKQQINDRLAVLTSDRQALLLDGISDQKELIQLAASSLRLHDLIEAVIAGATSPDEIRAEAQRILIDKKQTSSNFEALWVADTDGKVILASDPEFVGRDFSQERSFVEGRAGSHVGLFDRPTKGLAYSSTPIKGSDGRPLGELMTLWHIEPLVSMVADTTGLGESGEVIVGTVRGGRLDFLVPPRHPLKGEAIDVANFPGLRLAIDGQTGSGPLRDYRDVEVLAFHRPVGYHDWGLVAKIDVAEAYAPIAWLRNVLLALQGGILLVALAGAYLLARHIIRPIRQLTTTATAIAAGNLEARADVGYNDEIGSLAAAFNDMAQRMVEANVTLEVRVGRRTTELAASEERTRLILETAHSAFVSIDETGRIVNWNRQSEITFGWSRAEAIGRPLAETLIPFAYRQRHREGLQRFLETGEGPVLNQRVELSALHRDGHEFPIELTIWPLRAADGYRFNAFVNDITQRKESEQALQQQAKELARSNAELEQFAYVASHDLQEPLRMVASYVQLLARRYQGKLDADADDFIQFAVDGAVRMQALINDLLVYSRAGAGSRPLVPVDARAIVLTALNNLQVAIQESGAAVTCDELPTVMADETQLTLLFQNLIGNAIKFRGPDPAKIHVGIELDNGEWVFSVRDNGVGFDPKYAERIFLIFQRLNNRNQYPGTGIGLAICKKIVERHRGRIWAESESGRGSVFSFTLPVEKGESF